MQLNKMILNSTLVLGVLCSAELAALPWVDQIVNGDAIITQSAGANGNALQINQNTDKAIINWSSFNIAPNEAVHFQQPVDAICLNRIDSANGMSQINGNLTATANIILINQSGILFGESAQVNIGGLMASASDMADSSFLGDEKYVFDQSGGLQGAIINRGFISVADGLVGLLGTSVSNEGVIQANYGMVSLVSGDKFSFDFYGNGVLQFAIDAPATAPGLDDAGNPLPCGVNVSGQIINDAGAIYITAKAAQGVFDNLINVSGEVSASSVTENGGLIILSGESAGTVAVTGELNVSGTGTGKKAGEILVFGEDLYIADEAIIRADGDQSAGVIDIGWPAGIDVDLGLPVTPTQTVYVAQGATIAADTLTAGYGGRIGVWSTADTTFLGSASARGGNVSGDGGIVFVFSQGSVSDATVAKLDVSAVNGNAGDTLFSSDTNLIPALNRYLAYTSNDLEG